MDLYVAAAVLGTAPLGQQHWLTRASSRLRERSTDTGEQPVSTAVVEASTPLALLLALAIDPRTDDVRKRRVAQLFEWLSAAPEPFGPTIAHAAEQVRGSLRS